MTLLRTACVWLVLILLALMLPAVTPVVAQTPADSATPDTDTTAPLTAAPTEASKPPSKPVFYWRPLNYQNAQILRAGNYAVALPYVENGLKSCPDAVDAREAALCEAIYSENRGEIREHLGDLKGAEADFTVLIKRRADVLPPLDPLNAEALQYRAAFFDRQKRWADENNDLLGAEKIYRTMGPAQRPLIASTETRRAYLLIRLNRGADAIPLFQDAYALYRDAKGPADRSTMIAVNVLYHNLRNQGRSDESMRLAEDVLHSDQIDHYDPDERARLAANYAFDANTPSRQKNAQTYAEAALAFYQSQEKPKPDILVLLETNLARLDVKTGDAKKAATLAQQGLVLAVTTWGPQSNWTLEALLAGGDAQAALGHYDDALAQLDSASILLQRLNNVLPLANNEVTRGKILSKAGRNTEAIKSHQAMAEQIADGDATRAMKAGALSVIGDDLSRMSAVAALWTCEQAVTLGDGTPNLDFSYLVNALLCQANGLTAMGRADQAFPLIEKAQAIVTARAGRQAGAEVTLMWQNIVLLAQGKALYALKRYDEDIAVLRERLKIKQQIEPEAAPLVLLDIAIVAREAHHYPEALDAVSQGLTALGDTGPASARISLLQQRAYTDGATNDTQGAVQAYETILTLRRAEPDQSAIASAERDLGGALAKSGQLDASNRHLDEAIDIFRSLGPSHKGYLRTALNMRAVNANRQHDFAREETELREMLPLYAADSTEADGARLALANVLDALARHTEAGRLRTEAVAAVVHRFGADSAETMRTRLSELPWLRATGRYAEAHAILRDCLTSSEKLETIRLACLDAAAETALQEGAFRTAAGYGDQALAFVEDHWEQYNNYLEDTLIRRARAAAGMGDSEGLVRFYDRIHDISARTPVARGWVDETFIRLLVQAGKPGNAEPIEDRVLDQARQSNNTGLIVAVINLRADHLIDIGAATQVEAVWSPVLPLLGKEPSNDQLTVLDSLGRAANAMAQPQAAAQFFQQEAEVAKTLYGPGSVRYRSVLVEQAQALARQGRADAAEAAIAPLMVDASPAAALQHAQAELYIAMDAGDNVAALQDAREAIAAARAIDGADSLWVASARLTLAQVQFTLNKAVDQADMTDAIGSLLTQQPGWQAQIRVARLQGLLALATHRLDVADATFADVEKRLMQHKGARSLEIARARADRAEVRLEAGDAAGADHLFKEALMLASPDGVWRNAIWAQIATGPPRRRNGPVTWHEQNSSVGTPMGCCRLLPLTQSNAGYDSRAPMEDWCSAVDQVSNPGNNPEAAAGRTPPAEAPHTAAAGRRQPPAAGHKPDWPARRQSPRRHPGPGSRRLPHRRHRRGDANHRGSRHRRDHAIPRAQPVRPAGRLPPAQQREVISKATLPYSC
jgi:tetratricopeptide (TPR) repeat protein